MNLSKIKKNWLYLSISVLVLLNILLIVDSAPTYLFTKNKKEELVICKEEHIKPVSLTVAEKKVEVKIPEIKKDVRKDKILALLDKYNTNSECDNKIIANSIICESKKYKIDNSKLLTLILSESGGNKNVKHSVNFVHGICGINEKAWYKELKEKKIVSSVQELKSLNGNIKAMAYIYNRLHKRYGTFEKTVHAYKGLVPETMYQVKITMNIYYSKVLKA